jgi:hypothetical protein
MLSTKAKTFPPHTRIESHTLGNRGNSPKFVVLPAVFSSAFELAKQSRPSLFSIERAKLFLAQVVGLILERSLIAT